MGRALAGDRYSEVSTPEQMAAVLDPSSWCENDILCVAGGDGTIHGVLSALERRRPDGPWPVLAAAPGGTTNMTVKDLGPPSSLVAYLGALGRWVEAGGAVPANLVLRPVVSVRAQGRPPLAGMFFGAGAVSAAVDFFNRRLKPLGIPEAIGSPLAIARVLASLAMGGHHTDAMAHTLLAEVDGHPSKTRPTLLSLVTSLDRLILGARAHWGTEKGPLHVTLVDQGARSVFTSLPRLARGDPGNRLTPDRGWHSRDAHQVRLTFDGPFIVDGELYEARSEDGPLEISASRTVRWWMP